MMEAVEVEAQIIWRVSRAQGLPPAQPSGRPSPVQLWHLRHLSTSTYGDPCLDSAAVSLGEDAPCA